MDPHVITSAYQDAAYKPYGYLFLDFTQTTKDFLRIRTDIFPSDIDKSPPAVYLPNNDSDEPPLKRRKIY